jgi:hypothetical protein
LAAAIANDWASRIHFPTLVLMAATARRFYSTPKSLFQLPP